MATELGFYNIHGNGDVSVDPARKAAAFPALVAKAEATFVEQLMASGDLCREDAETVFRFYKKNKLVKRDSAPEYKVKHGAFWDHAIINRALELAEASAK
jgi:hypothetical protein